MHIAAMRLRHMYVCICLSLSRSRSLSLALSLSLSRSLSRSLFLCFYPKPPRHMHVWDQAFFKKTPNEYITGLGCGSGSMRSDHLSPPLEATRMRRAPPLMIWFLLRRSVVAISVRCFSSVYPLRHALNPACVRANRLLLLRLLVMLLLLLLVGMLRVTVPAS